MLNKYRPTEFEDVIGHDDIKATLQTLLKDRVDRPNLLFVGKAGIGKTTLAMVFSANYNIPKENIQHYNCFHFSGIENLRKTIESVFVPSIFGDGHALILDEIHGLSRQAQQELLLPLETLPPTTVVIACTTRLDKVDEALVSRFIRFDLKPLSKKQIKELIKKVCDKEGIKLSKEKISLLLKYSEGIPRRVLTGIYRIRDIENIEDVEYQLQLSTLKEEGEVFEFAKFLFSTSSWDIVKKKLDEVLKETTADNVIYSLINLVITRMLYYQADEATINLLDSLAAIPVSSVDMINKANLIVALYKYVRSKV